MQLFLVGTPAINMHLNGILSSMRSNSELKKQTRFSSKDLISAQQRSQLHLPGLPGDS